MLSRRRLLHGGLALGASGAGIAALAACAGTLPPTDTAAEGFGQEATGTVTVWCRAATQTAIHAIATSFNELHEDLQVAVLPIPDAQYVTKLATSIRGGSVPDLVDFDLINCPLFSVRDAFADVTELVQALPFRDSLSAGHIGLVTHEDRLYGIPFIGDYSTLFANTDLLGAAGFDLAEVSGSLESLMTTCQSLASALPDVHAWAFPGNASGAMGFTIQPMIWAAGTDLITGDLGDQSGNIVGNDVVEAVLEFHRQLWVDELVPQRSFVEDGAQWGHDYRSGDVVFLPSAYGPAVAEAEEGFRPISQNVLLPGPDGGTATFSGGDTMCILNGAPNASGAWMFMRYALELDVQRSLPTTGYMPVRSDSADAEFAEDYEQAVVPVTHLDEGYVPSTLAYNLLYNQSSSPWLAMIRRAVFDGDVPGAMAEAQSEYDRILTQTQL
ncbi:extracellular solute-binding protein [Brachybacterium sp. FME24]|uniref:extracellular solute-binding protein n=1 Tax=Brachybacterium sp. FME24 TaxID=2742605 RepID=UPI001868E24F|nr:extracellular solute-binding protein [Brachybacterium sp. FME24]